MQHHAVRLVRKRAEQSGFPDIGLLQQPQRLIRMTGQHDPIESVRFSLSVDQPYTLRIPLNDAHTLPQAHTTGKVCGESTNVTPTSAHDGSPLRPPPNIEQAMILEEPHKAGGREGQHGLRWTGPDGRRHRQQIARPQRVTESVHIEKLAQGLRLESGIVQAASRQAVEPHDLGQHPPVRRLEEVAGLAKQCAEIVAGVFQFAVIDGDAKRHVTGSRRDTKMAEKRREMRIIGFVVNDKARIDRNRSRWRRCIYGVRMATHVVVLLEYDHLMLPRQHPCGRKTGDSATHNGDLHSRSPSRMTHMSQTETRRVPGALTPLRARQT